MPNARPTAAALLAFALAPAGVASAAETTLADFEDSTLGQISDKHIEHTTELISPGLAESATAYAVTLGDDAGTYDALLDIPLAALKSAGLTADTATAVLHFDATFDGTVAPGGYNSLRVIANSDSALGNYEPAGDDLQSPAATPKHAAVDLTGVLPMLFDSGNTYATLRIIANKDAATTGTYTLDNIVLEVAD